MARRIYVLMRTLAAILTTFILLNLVFVVLRVLPGDPTMALLPTEAPEEARRKFAHEVGLDQPLHIQYIVFLQDIVSGDLGRSWSTMRLVVDQVSYALPATVELTLCAMFIAIIVGLLLGMLSALKHDQIVDHLIRLLNLFWYAMPIIWLGPTLQLVFGIYLKVLPISGRIQIALEPERIIGLHIIDSLLTGNLNSFSNAIAHIVMPALTLGMFITAVFTRISRAEIINALSQDYILTARAKGLPRFVIVYRHALKNALLPVITIMGLQFATTLGGAIMVEAIFNIPGMGSILLHALLSRDFPLMQGVLVFSVLWVALATWVMDISYSAIDPRVKY